MCINLKCGTQCKVVFNKLSIYLPQIFTHFGLYIQSVLHGLAWSLPLTLLLLTPFSGGKDSFPMFRNFLKLHSEIHGNFCILNLKVPSFINTQTSHIFMFLLSFLFALIVWRIVQSLGWWSSILSEGASKV